MNESPENSNADLSRVMDLLNNSEISIINLGLELFANTFREQGIKVVHVNWRPPASGDADLSSILAALDDLS